MNLENEKKHIECNALQIEDLEKLYEDGWKIYDTKPECNTEDIKILTMVKE